MSSSDMLTAIQYNEIMNQVPATIKVARLMHKPSKNVLWVSIL